MAERLVILHIDGLGADSLEQALREGDMPFVRQLMESEGYEIHRYRCGLPSTTPFVQAGILYGDNSEIPSFRWWDRERRVLVQFGAGSTFKKVADKYFQGCRPLTQDGACIAACYPAGAADDFGIAYQDRSYTGDKRSSSAWNVVLPYIANPAHVADWFLQAVLVLGRTVQEYTMSRASGQHPARAYLISDVLEEIFVHHITRYAVLKAMREGFSPIYAGFYAFDETGHAFGPDDPSSLRVLRHVDRTIKKVAAARGDRYELVVLSDHGQIDTVHFKQHGKPGFGELIADWLPGFRVQEMKGKAYGPPPDQAKGQVNVTFSGGLAHIYFASEARRLGYREVLRRHPDLAARLSTLDEVALLMARDDDRDVFMKNGAELEGDALTSLLARYDDAGILRSQLSRLNSFEAAGDLVVFGSFINGKQVNFENQAGGHGSIGGEQLHPFVLAKKDWGIDTSRVIGAHEIHPILSSLRDRLASR
ncbi:MAG TPA: alkaline phosphatase family protein [Candidatus Baltobacterales bacterium]|nr:alkaline phosphatase family protein [Candidatus Baltobacterales bacterium]